VAEQTRWEFRLDEVSSGKNGLPPIVPLGGPGDPVLKRRGAPPEARREPGPSMVPRKDNAARPRSLRSLGSKKRGPDTFVRKMWRREEVRFETLIEEPESYLDGSEGLIEKHIRPAQRDPVASQALLLACLHSKARIPL